MTKDEFTQLLENPDCPSYLPQALQALWYVKKGKWNTAHEIVQDASDRDSAWVHAYLHRQEGDLGNASYWYRRAGKPNFADSLAKEWEQISSELLLKVDA